MNVVIATTGTGGDLFPGIAVAESLRSHGVEKIQFVVSGWGPEEETLRSYGFPFERIRVGRLRGVSFPERVRTILGLPGVFRKAMRILKNYQGEVVLGSGGHTAGPVVLAAVLLRIRRAILEANATPGFTTRVLGPFVDRVYVGYPEGARFFHRRKVLLSGVPVRSSIRQIPPKKGGDFTLLAFGGSHGAAAINQALLEAYPLLVRSGRPFRVIHVTGEKDFQTIRRGYESYGEPGKRVELFPFLREIGEAYGKTDLVLSRAGASTLAELIAAGRPALLVPYPHAASHHQKLNAQSFIEKGGGELLLNEELIKGGGERLAERILYYEAHRELLAQMSERIGSLPGRDAAERIAKDLIDLVRSRRRG